MSEKLILGHSAFMAYPGAGAIVDLRAQPRTGDGTVSEIPDSELLERAVRSARDRNKRGKHTRAEAVMWAFAHGSTYASQLCRRFGLDPGELVR